MDHSLGRNYDDASERMSASLASLARWNGFERVDQVMLSIQNDHARAGENVFVVQGELSDPARRLAYMKTHDAVSTPVEQSLAQLNGPLAQPATTAMEQTPETAQRLRV